MVCCVQKLQPAILRPPSPIGITAEYLTDVGLEPKGFISWLNQQKQKQRNWPDVLDSYFKYKSLDYTGDVASDLVSLGITPSHAKFIAESMPDAFGYEVPEDVAAGCVMNRICLRLKLEYKGVDPLQDLFVVEWEHGSSYFGQFTSACKRHKVS
jgi:hypothetical protein